MHMWVPLPFCWSRHSCARTDRHSQPEEGVGISASRAAQRLGRGIVCWSVGGVGQGKTDTLGSAVSPRRASLRIQFGEKGVYIAQYTSGVWHPFTKRGEGDSRPAPIQGRERVLEQGTRRCQYRPERCENISARSRPNLHQRSLQRYALIAVVDIACGDIDNSTHRESERVLEGIGCVRVGRYYCYVRPCR